MMRVVDLLVALNALVGLGTVILRRRWVRRRPNYRNIKRLERELLDDGENRDDQR